MPLILLLVAVLLAVAPVQARELELSRFDREGATATLAAVQAAPESEWLEADAIRRQSQRSWWRLRLSAAGDDPQIWVFAIKESYDAELVAYQPPDYRPQPLGTFDPDWRQPGSRHRLVLQQHPEHGDAPTYVELRSARGQPLRVSVEPLATYLERDLQRVRFSTMVLSSLALLVLVAIVFGVALRRWHLLLFCVWVLCSMFYVAAMSGELVALFGNRFILAHAISLNAVGINVGVIALYWFVLRFLDLRRHHPRTAKVVRGLLLSMAVLTVWTALDPMSALSNLLVNIVVLLLSLIALAVASVRAWHGSAQGWFFLLGWGVVTVIGMFRVAYFIRHEGTPDWLELAHPGAYAFAALVLVLAIARAARYAEQEMHSARVVARTDPLTRLPNRHQLDQGLPELIAQARQEGQPLCLLFLDIDHFKAINDRHGHAVGDRCLIAIGRILRRHVRASDLMARYGGEEFVVALEGAARERAVEAAESLRAAVAVDGKVVDGREIGMTISIGITDLREADSTESLLARADAALYRAKREGRNRVVADLR